MNIKDDLKPCPFCSSMMVFVDCRDELNSPYQVSCSNCESSAGHYDSELAARIAWNNRIEVTK